MKQNILAIRQELIIDTRKQNTIIQNHIETFKHMISNYETQMQTSTSHYCKDINQKSLG